MLAGGIDATPSGGSLPFARVTATKLQHDLGGEGRHASLHFLE
jgi:hypothetical protein